jgi:glycosyltransferase involved in cell wall biosynthesis
MVVHLITGLNIGGSEMMLKKLVLSRRVHNFKDVIICLGNEGPIGLQLEQNGVKVHYLGLEKYSQILSATINLYGLLKKYKPTVLQTWLYHSDLLGGLVGRLIGIKVVWNIRQTRFTSNKPVITIFVMRICAVLSHFLPNVIVCAANSSMHTHVRYGYCKNKMKVIPNGFEFQKSLSKVTVKNLRLYHGVQKNDILIGTIGRYHVDKGYSIFLDACKIVSLNNPRAKFIMVGKNLDANNIFLLKMIRRMNLLDKFILIGETNNVNNYLSILDVFCLPSISEGFSNVLGEAMLKGLACVVTDVGDSKEIVGESGFVCEVNNPYSLANSILEILSSSQEKRTKMGLCAMRRIIDNYMLENSVYHYSNLYHELSMD